MAVFYLIVNSISLRLANQYMFVSLRVKAMSAIPGVFFKLKSLCDMLMCRLVIIFLRFGGVLFLYLCCISRPVRKMEAASVLET
jgi:hypothetical protein